MSWNIGDNSNLFLKLKSKLRLYHVVLTTPKISPEKLTLTVVEMQQLPDIEKIDSEEEIICLILGYGNSYLELLFPHLKKFRLHAILHDAAVAVLPHSGKGPGYCYMTGRGPNSCLLGHMTGLLFCLYVKIFLPSIFNSVDF